MRKITGKRRVAIVAGLAAEEISYDSLLRMTYIGRWAARQSGMATLKPSDK